MSNKKTLNYWQKEFTRIDKLAKEEISKLPINSQFDGRDSINNKWFGPFLDEYNKSKI